MIPDIKIIDIIHHRNKVNTQEFLVLSRRPIFLYERVGGYLIAEDQGFFNFYGYEPCGPGWKAFAGREFDIPMIDGLIIKASGQWWDSTPKDYRELVDHTAYGTIEDLNRCNVFCGISIDPEIISNWLAAFTPSNNYDKYRKGHENEGIDIIQSKWETTPEQEPRP